jgi:hypothetical protein
LPNLLSEHASLAEAMMNGHITPQGAQAATRVLRALQEQMQRSEPPVAASENGNRRQKPLKRSEMDENGRQAQWLELGLA